MTWWVIYFRVHLRVWIFFFFFFFPFPFPLFPFFPISLPFTVFAHCWSSYFCQPPGRRGLPPFAKRTKYIDARIRTQVPTSTRANQLQHRVFTPAPGCYGNKPDPFMPCSSLGCHSGRPELFKRPAAHWTPSPSPGYVIPTRPFHPPSSTATSESSKGKQKLRLLAGNDDVKQNSAGVGPSHRLPACGTIRRGVLSCGPLLAVVIHIGLGSGFHCLPINPGECRIRVLSLRRE